MKVCFRRDALIKLSRFLFYFSQLSAPFLVQFRGFGAQLPPLLFSFSLLKWFPRFRCRHIVISIDNLFPRRWRWRLGSRSVDVWIQIHKKGSSRARYPFSWEHIEKKFKLRDFVFSSLGVLPERMEGDFIRNLVLLWEGCFFLFIARMADNATCNRALSKKYGMASCNWDLARFPTRREHSCWSRIMKGHWWKYFASDVVKHH